MPEHTAQQVPHRTSSASGSGSASGSASGSGILTEHTPAVLAYAQAFCTRPDDASDLAADVLARGAHRQGPALRTALLADVRRTADNWLRDDRRELLRPEFLAWSGQNAEIHGAVDTLRRVERVSVLLTAFEELPEQPRAALWLCLAEEGESQSAAGALNASVEFTESLALSARSRLVDTVLRLRAPRSSDVQCLHYGGMLGAIARGRHRETPADLRQHLDGCRSCADDLETLRTLASGDAPSVRRLLVDELLVWGGTVYRRARSAERTPPPSASRPLTAGPPRPARAGSGRRERRRRQTVVSVMVSVVVTAVLTTTVTRVLLRSDTAEGAEHPRSTVSSAASPSPGRSPSPSASPSASPSPSSTDSASAGAVVLRSVATGRCVTGPRGNASAPPGPASAPDPVLAACDGGEDQRWRPVRLENGAVALVNAASKLCLDIAGDRVAGDGMQQRMCAYRQGADAPFPQDQAFVPARAAEHAFTLLCQDNPGIAVGVRSGEVRMRATAGFGVDVRFTLDGGAQSALGL
ncbi:RICIN domain-containing protein [Streptomyces sp. NPDC048277]|uniref:RICIN domain-containing protein n=1 Tax=Streptomyces sp. NPDC048277 TaxID=3155027 RepID=UPI0033D343A6